MCTKEVKEKSQEGKREQRHNKRMMGALYRRKSRICSLMIIDVKIPHGNASEFCHYSINPQLINFKILNSKKFFKKLIPVMINTKKKIIKKI